MRGRERVSEVEATPRIILILNLLNLGSENDRVFIAVRYCVSRLLMNNSSENY